MAFGPYLTGPVMSYRQKKITTRTTPFLKVTLETSVDPLAVVPNMLTSIRPASQLRLNSSITGKRVRRGWPASTARCCLAETVADPKFHHSSSPVTMIEEAASIYLSTEAL